MSALTTALSDSIALTRHPPLADLAALLADIRERGVISPPVVRETPDGPKRFEAVAGNGRITCLLALGRAQIEVINLGPISLAEALKVIVRDHTLRREMGSPEMTGYAFSYMRATGCPPHEALAALNITGSNRTKVGVVLNGPKECVDLVLSGRIPSSTAYEVMSKVRTPGEQIAFVQKAAAEKLTRNEVIALLRPKHRPRPKAGKLSFAFERSRAGLEKLQAVLKTATDAVAGALKLDIPDAARVEMVLSKLTTGGT